MAKTRVRWKGKSLDQIVSDINKIVVVDMKHIGYTALDESKKTPPTPVKTGHLRASERVRFEKKGWEAILYVNLNETPYARRIYYGWGTYKGRRYFEVGIKAARTQNEISKLEKDIEAYLDALK